LDEEIYVFCNVTNTNADKKLLKQIFSTQQAFSTLICSYSFKYLKELKQLSKDLILFAPIQQQTDFAGYNTFLTKLNSSEFVVYGNSTHHLPLIVKLEELDYEQVEPVEDEEVSQPVQDSFEDDSLDEEIKREVDAIYTVPKSDLVIEEEFNPDDLTADDLTEDDLDLIDDLNIVETDANEELIEDFVEELPFENVVTDAVEEIFEEELIEETLEENEQPQETFQEVFTNQEQEDETLATPALDILPVKMASTPIVPIYSADIESKPDAEEFVQGDIVSHQKYGKGTVEKLITYGSKTLCSINFDNVGRRLLDPTLADIKKV